MNICLGLYANYLIIIHYIYGFIDIKCHLSRYDYAVFDYWDEIFGLVRLVYA